MKKIKPEPVKENLRIYMDEKFWMLNLMFCMQYIYIDPLKLSVFGEQDEAIDVEATHRVITNHIKMLQEMDHVVCQWEVAEHPSDLTELRSRFFTNYSSIVKQLLFKNSIDVSDISDNYREIKNLKEFMSRYAMESAKLNTGAVDAMYDQVNDFERQYNSQQDAKKKTFKKIVNLQLYKKS